MLGMMLFSLIGVALGTFAGLMPGIHVNTLIVVVLSILPALLEHFTVYDIISMIVAMSVVQSFVNYIPSILTGAPEEDSVLSVLPGHRLLMQGRGYEAVWLTVLGGLGAIILGTVTLPFFMLILPPLYSCTRAVLPVLLTLVVIYMVYIEGSMERRLFALLIVGYSGLLGLFVLNGDVIPPKDALFPTFTGLFGISTMLTSIKTSAKMPPQAIKSPEGVYFKGIAVGTLAGVVAGLLPGIGSSQSALLVQNALKSKDEKEFLVAIGGVNASATIYAILSLYLIDNPRSGASIAVEYIMKEFTLIDLIFVIAVTLVVIPFAVVLTLWLARVFIMKMQEVDYQKLSKYILTFLVALIVALTGIRGMIVTATATAIGFMTPIVGVKRSHCMSVLVVPTIFYFLH